MSDSEEERQVVKSGWQKYDTIHPEVLKSLYEGKYLQPTEVQSYVLGTIKHYNDFIIASQTGSGKTLAFGIPIVSQILYEVDRRERALEKLDENQKKQFLKQNRPRLRSLIMAPTRELVLQIEQHLQALCKHSGQKIRMASLVGGISKEKQKRLLRYKPQILIGTPGRLWDFIGTENHPYLQELNQLGCLVLDEADRMVELGHFKEIDSILQRVFDKGTGKDQDKKIAREILEQAQLNSRSKKSLNDRLMEGEVLEIAAKDFEKQKYLQSDHNKKLEAQKPGEENFDDDEEFVQDIDGEEELEDEEDLEDMADEDEEIENADEDEEIENADEDEEIENADEDEEEDEE